MIMLRLLVQIGIVYDDDLDPLHDSDDGVVSITMMMMVRYECIGGGCMIVWTMHCNVL